MTKTYLYIPDDLNKQILAVAMAEKRSKADVLREALEKGVEAVGKSNAAGIQVLFDIIALGKKYKVKGPKNSASRIDELLWDRDWSKDD